MCKISLINKDLHDTDYSVIKCNLDFVLFEVQYYNTSDSLNKQVIKPGVKGSFVFTKISIEPPVKHLHVTIIWLKMVGTSKLKIFTAYEQLVSMDSTTCSS